MDSAEDRACDFDQTLRNMLSMPPQQHTRKGEHDDASEDVQTTEDEVDSSTAG